MKTKEQVLGHLKQVGYTKRAIDKICAYMIAKELKNLDEKIIIKKGDNDFESFVDWFNQDEVETIMEGTAKSLNNYLSDLLSDIDTQNRCILKKCNEEKPKYKDGDVLVLKDNRKCIFIYKAKGVYTTSFNVGKYSCGDFADESVGKNFRAMAENDEVDYATEAEKKYFFDLIKAQGKKWDSETKKLEDLENYKYKVGDYVKIVKSLTFSWLVGKIAIIEVIEDDCTLKLNGKMTGSIQGMPNLVEPSTKAEYDKQCRQERTDKAKKEFEEWKGTNARFIIRNETLPFGGRSDGASYGASIMDKIHSYLQLYLFAQWQNGSNRKDIKFYYLVISDDIIKANHTFGTINDGSIYFHTVESAKLAIDVLGEELIKKALM